jgi:drug/metabolite transporter (DMT)-like permease
MDAVQTTDSRLAELRNSARGWHGVQLAVLGFIGLCGVLSGDASDAPRWLEWLSMYLALGALACACVATYLVGAAAWPLYRARSPTDGPGEIEKTSRRVTSGLVLTFVAVILLALATASTWWPSGEGEGGNEVLVQTTSGQTACGELAESQEGSITLISGERSVAVPLQQVSALNPSDGC